ncbi:hypothetical protein F5890DRAFT_1492381 [Lentinula detonsa]|uniref:Uncharacterized protein n=1 Tax=Lentinula detonsa TaxID=2804962 RepID=A0AA38Q7L5_9AGAR|nr:hypothetical protein F5890DRAFT_1492381 [Lentinula detonsa]
MNHSPSSTACTILRSSAPIEIPSRRKSMSPSPILYAPRYLSVTSPTASELLFEMSPLEPEVHRDGTTIHFPQMYSSETSLPSRVIGDGYHLGQRSSLLGSSRRRYSPCSPTVGFPSKKPEFASLHKWCNLINAGNCRTQLTPPVIRTTAVHKINGFAPTNPTLKASQPGPPGQTQLNLVSSNSNLLLPTSQPLGLYEQYDSKSDGNSGSGMMKFRQKRFENHQIRP